MDNKDQTPEEGTEKEVITPKADEGESKAGTPPEDKTQTPDEKDVGTGPAEIDYKKKFAESTRENQVLAGKIKEKEAQLGIITKDEPPTEAEMRKLYPDWDDRMEDEKEVLRKQVSLERRINRTNFLVEKLARERERDQEIGQFLEKASILDEFSGLKGREKEFKEFVAKPSHKGVDLDTLARAFLYQPVSKPAAPPKQKGTLLEKGSGGKKEITKVGFTPEQIRNLRINDPDRYNQLVKERKIKIEL